jgi:hypothetical protein
LEHSREIRNRITLFIKEEEEEYHSAEEEIGPDTEENNSHPIPSRTNHYKINTPEDRIANLYTPWTNPHTSELTYISPDNHTYSQTAVNFLIEWERRQEQACLNI